MQSHRTMTTLRGTMNKMNQIIKDMKAINMSVSLTIFVEDLEVEDDFLEIATIDHDEPYSDSLVIKKDTAM